MNVSGKHLSLTSCLVFISSWYGDGVGNTMRRTLGCLLSNPTALVAISIGVILLIIELASCMEDEDAGSKTLLQHKPHVLN